MVVYHKNFSKENFETEDLWRVSGIDDETAKKCETITDKQTVALNRARAKAMFIAEEIGAEINIEQNESELRIVISKQIQ